MDTGTRSGRAVGVLAVLVVAAVAGLSLASTLLGDDGSNPRPDVPSTTTASTTDATGTTVPIGRDLTALPAPQPGQFTGRLAYVDGDCRLSTIDLPTLQRAVLATDIPGCRVSLSPTGRFGVFSLAAGQAVQVVDFSSGSAQVVGRGPALGPPGYGPPAVSDDGTVAVCRTSALNGQAGVAAVDLGGASRPEVEGCRPAFAGTLMLVASRDARTAVRNSLGEVVLRRRALARPSRGDLVIATSADGGLIGVLSRTEGFDRVDLSIFTTSGEPRGAWRDLQSGADLRTLRISPDGLAAAADVNGFWRVAALHPGGRLDPVEEVAGARIDDVDFAPDGSAAAVAVQDAIVLVDPTTLGPLYAIPADARSLRWLP